MPAEKGRGVGGREQGPELMCTTDKNKVACSPYGEHSTKSKGTQVPALPSTTIKLRGKWRKNPFGLDLGKNF